MFDSVSKRERLKCNVADHSFTHVFIINFHSLEKFVILGPYLSSNKNAIVKIFIRIHCKQKNRNQKVDQTNCTVCTFFEYLLA